MRLTEYQVPIPPPIAGGGPASIAAGPDGSVWFTEGNGDLENGTRFGRVTPTGVITDFSIPALLCWAGFGLLGDIVTGSDGNLWIAEYSGSKIWRTTTTGVMTSFPLSAGSSPLGMTLGPDGNLWFTERFANYRIGKITPTGLITEFSIPTSGSWPYYIAAGPDGALWFTENAASKIGRITTGGVITEFSLPPSGLGDPLGITAGTDGNLWFTESNANRIARITTGGIITEFPVPTSGASPILITSGPDGNLWFAERYGNQIGRVTTAGVVTEFSVPTANSQPYAITVGPDCNLWFTEAFANKVGKVLPGVLPVTTTLTGTMTDDGLPLGATLTATWSATIGPVSVPFSNPTATFADIARQTNPVVTSASFCRVGSYTVGLTGSDSLLSSSASATVTVNTPQVSLLSLTPNIGVQGQQNLSVNITAQSTQFVQGTTSASFGAGIVVSSLAVNSPTSATARCYNINSEAVVGSRVVSLTTGNQIATLQSGFSVTSSAPIITQFRPNSGRQGQAVCR